MATPDLFIKETPDFFIQEEQKPAAPITPLSLVTDIGVGAVETVATGLSALPAMASKGLSLLGGATEDAAEAIHDFFIAEPVTKTGKKLAELASAPFEWWDKENQEKIGEPIRTAGSQLLQNEFGIEKDNADTWANVLGTLFETPGRALPYIAGLKGPGRGTTDAPPKVGDTGVEPLAPKVYTEKAI